MVILFLFIVVTALILVMTTGCEQQNRVVSLAPDPAPAKQRAMAAFQEFSSELKAELQAAINAGGPVRAVAVCSERAPQIAEKVSKAKGFSMGRSSHRVRNTSNAPSKTVSDYLKRYADRPAKEAVVEVTEEDGEWLVIAPIATKPLCLTCHGSPDALDAELKETLGKYYPDDSATGFKAGQLRGVFWARLPQEAGGVNTSLPLEQSSRKIKTH